MCRRTDPVVELKIDVRGLSIAVTSTSTGAAAVDETAKGRKRKSDVHSKDILVDAHLRLKQGVRYGLIGRNGTGKSSEFLRIFRGARALLTLRWR